MTTATTAPPTPDVLALASSFDIAARTAQFGLEQLFSRWLRLRIAGARYPRDLFASVSFSTVLDAVLDHRSNPAGVAFSVLAIATGTRS
jgi:hypothetical protein